MSSPAHRRFRAWFKWLGISQAELARRLKCDQSVVSYLLSTQRNAGLKVAVSIERESADWPKGPIKVPEWSRGAASDEEPAPTVSARAAG